MKMKKLQKTTLLLAMAVLMSSCRGPIAYMIACNKMTDGTLSLNSKEDTIHFVIKDNQILLEGELNDEKDTLFYDSGAAGMITKFYTKDNKPKDLEFYNVPMTMADKKGKVKIAPFLIKGQHAMDSFDGFGQAILLDYGDGCDGEVSVSRYTLLGFGGLSSRHKMDFTNNRIYKMTLAEMDAIDTTEYVPVKCRTHYGVMLISLKVNGVEHECIFDTGNSGAILLKDGQRTENPKETDYVLEGSYGIAVGGASEKQRFVLAPKEAVDMAGTETANSICYLKDVPNENVGLKFISKFDWIIDQRQGGSRMYAKPRVIEDVSDKPFEMPFRYALSTHDGSLKIITRLIDGNERFKVGDQIISVNGEKITEENICHYYDLLTENKDWSGFDIKVK